MYKKGYFYISSGYMSVSDEQQEKFFEEIVNLFVDNGWEIKTPRSLGVCPEVRKDKTELYIHPSTVSGNINMELLKEIEAILNSGKTFRYDYNADYGEVFDWSDEEYLKYLDENRDAIKNDLIDAFKTKRSNLYIYTDFFSGPLRNICDKYRKERLTDAITHSDNLDYRYISNLFKSFVADGEILAGETNKGICYRTAKPTETKIINEFKKWCEYNDKSFSIANVTEYGYSGIFDLAKQTDGNKMNLLYSFAQATENIYENQAESNEDDEEMDM